MLTPPALADDCIIATLHESYGLRVARSTFLPIGDAGSAHYRVELGDGTPYFLKLRGGDLNEAAVAVPAWLHALGIRHVLAPISTSHHGLWAHAHGYAWMLYPFIAGENGFRHPLTRAHWIVLGECMAAVHATILPAEIGKHVPREDFSPRWRDTVRSYQEQIETGAYDDPVARHMAAFWHAKADEISAMVERAEQLGQTLRTRAGELVCCHADLHAGNVLVEADSQLTIVDWDAPILAPKERDLMFVGGGVGGVWHDAQEEALFYQGYGATELDPVALSYYRYERIVEDLAVYAEQIFEMRGSAEDRAKGLRVSEQFLPRNVVEIAHTTYQRLR